MTIQKEKLIEVKVTSNPKRKGSLAYEQFAILAKHNGRPVKEFLKQEGRHPSLDKRENWTMLELYHALRLDLVKLKNQARAA
jgi:hypothetical protein